jgi:hypothetical protein
VGSTAAGLALRAASQNSFKKGLSTVDAGMLQPKKRLPTALSSCTKKRVTGCEHPVDE